MDKILASRATFFKGLKFLCLFLNRIKHKASLLLLFVFVIKWGLRITINLNEH